MDGADGLHVDEASGDYPAGLWRINGGFPCIAVLTVDSQSVDDNHGNQSNRWNQGSLGISHPVISTRKPI
jgi:hypothetical protein